MSGDEWLTDDLPVLQAVRDLEDEGGPATVFRTLAVANRCGLPEPRVNKLLLRLAEADYINARAMSSLQGLREVSVRGLTEKGRRAVGQWPSNDPWTGLVELLSQRIEDEQDETQRGKLVQFRDGVLSSGRAVGVSLLSAFLEQQAGL